MTVTVPFSIDKPRSRVFPERLQEAPGVVAVPVGEASDLWGSLTHKVSTRCSLDAFPGVNSVKVHFFIIHGKPPHCRCV